ncbi:hypothetical protein MPSEU_000300200 [Mayamaea pseudoterrestris]|nr:hypothetical protein MPSEU_000300200 [Mayamaea pseudoterrestris]
MLSPLNDSDGLLNDNRDNDAEQRLPQQHPHASTKMSCSLMCGECSACITIIMLAMADRLQQLPASPRVLRWMRRWKRDKQSTMTHNAVAVASGGANDNDNDDKDGTVYWIQGLDQVVLGNKSFAESVVFLGQFKLLPYLCYMLSGMVCDVLMLLTDLAWHFWLGIQDATTCWVISFTLSIVPRHSALKVMCFGKYVGGYYHSLARMYLGMSASIALSTIGNYLMTKHWGVAHYVAWVVTLIWTGVVNYFVLKKCWTFGDDKVAESE